MENQMAIAANKQNKKLKKSLTWGWARVRVTSLLTSYHHHHHQHRLYYLYMSDRNVYLFRGRANQILPTLVCFYPYRECRKPAWSEIYLWKLKKYAFYHKIYYIAICCAWGAYLHYKIWSFKEDQWGLNWL